MHREEALFANEAFYLAFAAGDLQAMEALWSGRADIVCIHPGWPALTSRAEVMESWSRILGNPDQPPVSAHPTHAVPWGDGVVVVCYERVGDAVMVASNLFLPEAGEPRLIMHQAGLCGDPPELPAPRPQGLDA